MSVAVTEQIVAGIAEAEGTPPEELEIALQDYVSTDAIRDLVAHDSDAWQLEFETERHVVELTGDNMICVDGEHWLTFS